MKNRAIAVIAVALIFSSCRAGKEKLSSERKQTAAPQTLNVTSTAFTNDGAIPKKYATDDDISPPLAWSGGPAAARSIAVFVEDPDAPMPQPFVHWLIYNISPTATSLPEGIKHQEKLDEPIGAMQGKNSMMKIGYYHMAPPPGDKPHHYHFQVYALDTTIDETGIGRSEFLKAIDGHVLAKGEIVGTYKR
jgi:Raf kinase inhibitor-like YbhB/YbcL family protein